MQAVCAVPGSKAELLHLCCLPLSLLVKFLQLLPTLGSSMSADLLSLQNPTHLRSIAQVMEAGGCSVVTADFMLLNTDGLDCCFSVNMCQLL